MKSVIAIILVLAFVGCSTTRTVAPKAQPAPAPVVTDDTVLPGEMVVEHPFFPMVIMVEGKHVAVVGYDNETDSDPGVVLLEPVKGMYPVRLGKKGGLGGVRHNAVYLENGVYGLATYEDGRYEKYPLNRGRFVTWRHNLLPCLIISKELKLYKQKVPFCGTPLRWKYNITMGVAEVPVTVKAQEVPTTMRIQEVKPMKAQEVSH